ncbi:hypothetical protein DBR39_12240 [Chryseobacterium sp. KBW03]|uniref:TlpA family protein disulfide reductase n=1 Tax=Chryseobacterium sp. KBW03 TaxID=2153362 RepID=UPI000F5A1F64|nr:TlpA disulfide reductase family protein [Chryseobacterium sp. KBW03]RQO37655.1 hypothetical protein DBR39_12240 [Chryseobacterium sp. KBW03]
MEKIIFFTIAFFCVILSSAQNKSRTIYIDIIYPTMTKDTVMIEYQHNGMSLSALEKVKISDSLLNNHFEINPEKDDKIFYLSFSGKKQYFLINYLVEPGDSIQIFVEHAQIQFRGRGSEKYQCRYEMDNINKVFPWQRTHLKYNVNKGELIFDSLYYTNYIPDNKAFQKRQYSAAKCSEEVLKWYKDRLSVYVYNLLLANLYGDVENRIWNSLNIAFNSFVTNVDPIQKKEIQDSLVNIYLNRNVPNFSKIPDSVLAFSHTYLTYLCKGNLRKGGFAEAVSLRKDPSLKKTELELFSENHQGILRDKLITQYLITNFAELPNISNLISYAMKNVSDPESRKLLSSLNHTNTKGSKGFAFNLPDFYGNFRTLNEFRGKVILLDFWFTGCSSCAIMAKNLKPVAEYFKNNKNVIFISISTDERLSIWRKSVIQEIYTNKHSVDLFTEGKGIDHPIIKHYKIKGYPTLIMIGKDSKVITTSVIKPYNEKDKNDLIKLIEKNL